MSQPIVLKWKKLNASAVLPEKATSGAAAFDLRAALESEWVLHPRQVLAIPTGLAVEVPAGYELQVRARSGLAFKHGFALVNGVGTIDSDYRGEIKIIATILGEEPLTIRSGDRIAQGLVAPVLSVVHQEVEALSDTERGVGGFGSTGRA